MPDYKHDENTGLSPWWLAIPIGLAVFIVAILCALAFITYRWIQTRPSSNQNQPVVTSSPSLRFPQSPTPRSTPRSDPQTGGEELPPPPAPTPTSSAPTISGGVLNGKAISLPKPVYPNVARAANVSGAVVVQVTVDEDGNVISAVAVSGHPLLRAAAVAAAREAKFSPTKLSGKPVKVAGILTYNFAPE